MFCDLLVVGETPEAWAAVEVAAARGANPILVRPEYGATRPASLIPAVLDEFGHSSGIGMSGKILTRWRPPGTLVNQALARYEGRVASRARRLGIAIHTGPVRLAGTDAAEVFIHGTRRRIAARLIVIATGTTAARPREWPIEPARLILPEDVGRLARAPRRLLVLGGNRTARAFARLFAVAGSDVTRIDSREVGAPYAQRDAIDEGTELIRDEVVDCVERRNRVRVRLARGGTCEADSILLAAGRHGATASLGLSAAGLEADDRGRLWCDDQAMTWIPTIAAAGEVIGYPRHLSAHQRRIDKTIAEKLELETSPEPAVVSIRMETAEPAPRRGPRTRRVRTRHQRTPALRVYSG